MHIHKTQYLGWQVLACTTGDLQWLLLPDLGGRIISLSFQDQPLLFVQPEHQGETFDLSATMDLSQLIALKQQLGFRVWGGDKTWISPQSAWLAGIPPLDLDAGRYQVETGTDFVRMTSPICRETGVQIIREVRVPLHASATLELHETCINQTAATLHRGIWNVTQLLQPAEVMIRKANSPVKIFKEEGDSEQLYAQRVIASGGSVQIDCRTPGTFKYGVRVAEGSSVESVQYFPNRAPIHWVREFAVTDHATYAHGCTVEVYNSSRYPYLEVEIHAPFVPIPAGGQVATCQQWRFWTSGVPEEGT